MFKLIDSYEWIRCRNFRIDDRDVLNGTNIRALEIGEWLQLDSSYQMGRGGDNAGNYTDEASVPSWPTFAERGRYDTQATAKGLIPTLWLLGFEARTTICTTAGGAGITAVGQPLSVFDVIGSDLIVRRGLGRNNAGLIVGYVTRLNGTNDINFVRTLV